MLMITSRAVSFQDVTGISTTRTIKQHDEGMGSNYVQN